MNMVSFVNYTTYKNQNELKSAWYTSNEIRVIEPGESNKIKNFSHSLTISSMFFSEKYRWVNLRTYCCTVSSLLFFVWLGDFANISNVIFPILKLFTGTVWRRNVWAYYRQISRDQQTVIRLLGNNYWAQFSWGIFEREGLCQRRRQTRWRRKWQVSVFSWRLPSPLNYSRYIHIVCFVHY